MSRSAPLKEDLELNELRQAEQQLLMLQRECAKLPKKLALEQKERECTMPPLAEIEDRIRRKAHENTVLRGEVTNILRDQNRSILLIILLLAATGSLIWWGTKLMQG
jgi:non-ribosomal peptide synthetase component F